MTRPSPDMMRRGADLLDAAIGTDGGPSDVDLEAVVQWLRETADNDELRAMCRAAGVPVAKVRAKM